MVWQSHKYPPTKQQLSLGQVIAASLLQKQPNKNQPKANWRQMSGASATTQQLNRDPAQLQKHQWSLPSFSATNGSIKYKTFNQWTHQLNYQSQTAFFWRMVIYSNLQPLRCTVETKCLRSDNKLRKIRHLLAHHRSAAAETRSRLSKDKLCCQHVQPEAGQVFFFARG